MSESDPIIHYLSAIPTASTDSSYLLTTFGNKSITFLQSTQRATRTLPTVSSTSFVQTNPSNPLTVVFTGLISTFGSSPITENGVAYGATASPTIAGDHYEYTPTIQAGSYAIGPTVDFGTEDVYARAYATNAFGTSYGADILLNIGLCLAKGTLITLSSGEKKPIEDITYDDLLKVWDFDLGEIASALPLWIMKVGIAKRYNLLTFSDGSTLKTINQHRIYNKEKGEFTYPMTDSTPIGTSTYTEDGVYITLVSKEVIEEEIEYYNVITYRHINLFSNTILTSCHYNNIYNMVDMKFAKVDRVMIPYEAFEDRGISKEYYDGFRLSEQELTVDIMVQHLHLLDTMKV